MQYVAPRLGCGPRRVAAKTRVGYCNRSTWAAGRDRRRLLGALLWAYAAQMTPQAASPSLARPWRHVPRRGASQLWLIGLALAVAVFVAGLLIGPQHDPAIARHLDGVTIVLLGVACATLVIAGSRPVGAWAAAAVIGVVDTVHSTALSTAAAPGILALFAVAVLRDLRITVAATTATIVAYGLSVVPLHGSWWSTASTLGAWSVTVSAIGVAVRAQRAALQAARERALQAEATREEEAQRRVVDERLRIARELHDVIAHHASVINVQSGVAGHLMTTQPEQASAALVTVRDASRMVVKEMGQLVELLRSTEHGRMVEPSPGLDQLDELVTATRNAGLALDFDVVGQPAQRTPAVDLIAYRVVQEAITNALKHGTGRAELRVEFARELIAIDVRNPIAPGADTEHGREQDRASHGLLGMRERLIAVGGSLSIGPDAHHRFVLHAEIPLERT